MNDGELKTCLSLILPWIDRQVLYGLNAVFGGMFVGRLVGEEAPAGVSIVYPLT